ncbi:Hint domain-containing protein [Marivita sp.]|uniref:Hint domain-containing protein n=1 Tax=Marivita sp. TaxID=2003365 RepID=UPI003A88B4BF
MATRFEVISLGFSGIEIDTTELDNISNAANLLVGTSYGSASAPLFNNIQTLSQVTLGTIYDTDNNTVNDQFSVGGTAYIVDGAAIYLATVTYADGTTDQVQVTLVQASSGDLFLFPPVFGDEDEQAVLEAGPIQSLSLDSLVSNAVEPQTNRIDIDFDGPVDGTGLSDGMTVGYTDGQGDQIGAGDDLIFGNGGNDTIEGGGGGDIIEGGAGNDVIYGDTADGSTYGTLSPTNSDNLADSSETETFNTRAVELVTLANGDLIMITSERTTSDSGIASYRIDNNPDSASYGQVLGGQIDIETAAVNGVGYQDIEDMAAVTLSNGATYLYTADPQGNAIGITLINADGTLANQPPLTDGSGNNLFDDVQELSIATVGDTYFLLSLGGGSDGGIDDALIVHRINADGSLTQTDIEVDGSGTGENFLNNNSPTEASLLESFTDSNGTTFVIAGGADDGISLWTLNSAGQLTFQNAREDDAAGAADTDPQGNGLGRDLINPATTGLFDVDAGTFAEIDGRVYLFVGGVDDDVVIFRVDPDTTNNDGTFDLTLVGQVDNLVTDISAMTFLPTDSGGSLVVGAETSGLRFYDVTVNPDGTVSLTLSDTISDGAGPEFADSEAIDVEGGILVSAGDNDDGVGIVTTGLNPEAQFAGNDSIVAGDGDDTVVAGDGNDTVDGGNQNDVIYGGSGADSLIGGAGNDAIYGDTTLGAPVTVNNGDFATNTSAGWTVSGGGSTFVYSQEMAFNASDSGFGGVVQQTVTTQVGLDYRLSVSAREFGSGTGDHTLVVEAVDANGQVLGSQTVVIANGTANQVVTVDFTATTTDVTLRFTNPTSTGTVTTDLKIDNVTVTTLPTETIGANDTIEGGDGNDTIFAGGGNDTINGGEGGDTIDAGAGDDLIIIDGSLAPIGQIDDVDGGDGVDTLILDPTDNRNLTVNMSTGQVFDGVGGAEVFSNVENITTADGNDTVTDDAGDNLIITNGGNDVLQAGTGSDTLFGGDGNDLLIRGGTDANDVLNVLDGGAGDDTICLQDGINVNDQIDGGDGIDTLEVLPGDNRNLTVNMDAGNVVDGTIGTQEYVNIENITTGGGNDTIYGSLGNNVLDGGAGDDLVVGGGGADWIIGGTGNDVLVGGNNGNAFPISGDQTATGNDTLDGGAGNDTLYGNTGSDTLLGGADNDLLLGEWGTDRLDGGAGADTLNGGAQNDTLSGGTGNDLLTGGDGNDRFQYTAGDGLDTISDFNAGTTGTLNDGTSANNDFIDLSGHYDHLFELWADQQDDGILNQSNAFDTQGNAVDYSDNSQFDTDGTPNNEGIFFSGATGDNTFFNTENTGVICFADGTLIGTPRGPVPVENLSEGDLVRTIDHGYRPVIWASHTKLSWSAAEDGDKPILIKANALGAGLPVADLRVSPQHRILLPDTDRDEGVFAPAKSLVGLPGIRQMKGCRSVTYHHLLLDQHEVIFANELPCESFFPGRMALDVLSGQNRSSILRCLMKLSRRSNAMRFRLARRVLKSKAVKKRVKEGTAVWTQDMLRRSGCLEPALDALG